ncbi:MAG: NADH-quinone oxidoreductase subunit NuoE [Trueperaceae bacterium]|nr:NADH-quinone oxidoreductase subunit NuoE [Trueperaceae bacterium]
MIELQTVTPFFEDKVELLDEILGRYPDYGRRSAVMPLLWEVQRAERYVSESRVAEIAEILGLHATEVKGVMSFYSTYHGEPVGRWHLQVCSTLSCKLAGSDELCDHLVETLGLVPGETDAEGRFSLQKVECLGSCTTAPVLQVNDTYYERVTRGRLEQLLDALKRDEQPEPWRERHGDNAGLGGAPLAGTTATAAAETGEAAGVDAETTDAETTDAETTDAETTDAAASEAAAHDEKEGGA